MKRIGHRDGDIAHPSFQRIGPERETGAQGFGQRPRDGTFDKALVRFEFVAGADIAFEVAGRVGAGEGDDAARRILAEEQRLRPRKDFDLRKVEVAALTIRPRLSTTPSIATATLWSSPGSVDVELIPRMPMTAPVPTVCRPMITWGASSAIFVRSVATLFASAALETTATAVGTSYRLSDWRRAVTMISSPDPSASAAAVGACCAHAGPEKPIAAAPSASVQAFFAIAFSPCSALRITGQRAKSFFPTRSFQYRNAFHIGPYSYIGRKRKMPDANGRRSDFENAKSGTIRARQAPRARRHWLQRRGQKPDPSAGSGGGLEATSPNPSWTTWRSGRMPARAPSCACPKCSGRSPPASSRSRSPN